MQDHDEMTGTENIEALFRLTPTQEGILYHSLLAPESGVYIQQYVCSIEGELDVDAFRSAWSAVSDRHPAMRTLIVSEGQENPLQLVRGRVEVPYSVEDLSSLDQYAQQGRIAEYLARDRSNGIRLDDAPLLRVKLFILEQSRFRMVWTHHHLTIDGWSTTIVLDDVFDAYRRIVSGHPHNSAPGPRFQAFVKHLTERDRSEAKAYWTGYLQGVSEPNHLDGFSRSAASPWTDYQEEASCLLPSDLTRGITAFVRANNLTLNTLVRGAWALVMNRYSGDEDLVFGATVSGRPPEVEDSLETVGLFINTVPVRVKTDAESIVLDWLTGLHRDQLQMDEHDWVPLPEIQDWAETKPGHPLFTSLVVLENLAGVSKTGQLQISDEIYEQRSNYPLALLVFPNDQMKLVLLHDPQRFPAAVASRMLHQVIHTLGRLITASARSLGELSVLPPHELGLIVDGWNPAGPGFTEKTILDDIVKAADQNPATVAITGSGIDITYQELIERAGAVRDRLRAMDVEIGSKVVSTLDRTPGAIVAIIGIMMAGGTYVPVDPGLPPIRMESILIDTAAIAILGSSLAEQRRVGSGVPTLTIEPDGRIDDPAPESGDATEPDPEDIAYVIYTSGSTGSPKGVEVGHGSLAYSTQVRDQVYPGAPSSFLLLSPLFFDSSIVGIFWTLARGGSLVLPGSGMEQDTQHLGELIRHHEVTHLLALPTVYDLMLDSVASVLLASLEVAIVAGEPCPPRLAGKHHRTLPETLLMNEYGPTEATVWATAYEVTTDDADRDLIPVGRPIPGTDIFILDSQERPVPVGAVGELFIGGPGVAHGYLNNPDLTADNFITIDLPRRGETRLYRSGDLARYDESGVIELIGRVDSQVKIRGRRVEPGEIETVAARHPDVDSAAVRVSENGAGGLELSLFYVARAGTEVDPPGVRSFLSDQLPTYLVPEVISPIPAIPLTANGKVDRNRLPLPEHGEIETRDGQVPATETEQLVLELTRALLGHNRVQITDNFFDVGGHSLLSMHLIARIFTSTGVTISPNVILFNSLRYAAFLVDQSSSPTDETNTLLPTQATSPARARRHRRDQPIRFGSGKSLFGVFHRPEATDLTRGPVLICPPFGWEYYKTHWALRNLARQLGEENHAVLRFDYSGTGDSDGEPGDISVAGWINDIRLAIVELRRLTDSQKVTIVGLRLGATLAAQASLPDAEMTRLVMWDPVVSGAAHLASLEQMHKAFFARNSPRAAARDSGHELLGSPYPPYLRKELEDLDLTSTKWGSYTTVTAVISQDQSQYRELNKASLGTVEIEVVDDAGSWTDLTTFNSALLPTRIPRRIVELLGGQK